MYEVVPFFPRGRPFGFWNIAHRRPPPDQSEETGFIPPGSRRKLPPQFLNTLWEDFGGLELVLSLAQPAGFVLPPRPSLPACWVGVTSS